LGRAIAACTFHLSSAKAPKYYVLATIQIHPLNFVTAASIFEQCHASSDDWTVQRAQNKKKMNGKI
jgi:hypothetical protein